MWPLSSLSVCLSLSLILSVSLSVSVSLSLPLTLSLCLSLSHSLCVSIPPPHPCIPLLPYRSINSSFIPFFVEATQNRKKSRDSNGSVHTHREQERMCMCETSPFFLQSLTNLIASHRNPSLTQSKWYSVTTACGKPECIGMCLLFPPNDDDDDGGCSSLLNPLNSLLFLLFLVAKIRRRKHALARRNSRS